MSAGGKKSKRRRQQAYMNGSRLPAANSGSPSASTGTQPEEPPPPAPLGRVLALDDLQLMKTCSDARYLRTFGFLCYLLAMCSFGLLLMKIYKEPPPSHPLHGTFPFVLIIINAVFFLVFGILFRNLRCNAARILMKTFAVICLSLLGLWLVFSILEAVTVGSDLTAVVVTGGFLLVFYFIFRALGNPLLFGPETVTYRQLILIRRKRMQEEKITPAELPPCRIAGKFDFTVIVIAWISLVLMFAGTFSSAFIKVPAPGMETPEQAQSAPPAPVQTAVPAKTQPVQPTPAPVQPKPAGTKR